MSKLAIAVRATWQGKIRVTIQRLLGKYDTSTASNKQCKCRKKDLYPLNDVCLVNNIIYKATVTTTLIETRVYIGMTEMCFKMRFNNNKVSFKHRKR